VACVQAAASAPHPLSVQLSASRRVAVSPLLLLAFSIAFVAIAIVKLRIHPFLVLITAAALVGLFSPEDLVEPAERRGLVSPEIGHAKLAVELALREFGAMVGSIGLVIVLASIIGSCLLESGAADRITRFNLRAMGERQAPVAMMFSAFILSIPVFLDTVFFMLVPIAKAFRMRTGKNYVLYVMSICAGGVLTHSLVAPTPGPLLMAETLKLDLAITILAGLAFSIIPAIAGLWYSMYLNRKLDIPLREGADGSSLEDLAEIVQRSDEQLPSLWISLAPIIAPVILISCGTIVDTIDQVRPLSTQVLQLGGFLGDKNVALAAGALLGMLIYLRQPSTDGSKAVRVVESAIGSAGVVILITAAGGAFGAMIRHAGVGEAISQNVPNLGSGIVLVLLAFGLAMVLKIAQGSGTVSMITTSAIMFSLIQDQTLAELPVHPIYLFLAIGYGSMPISWMNDSGFWIIGRMSGFTEKETLKTWTMLLLVIPLVGLVQILLVSMLLPLKSLPW